MTTTVRPAAPRWWERYPERLERELQALTAAGIAFTPIPEDLARGVYSLRLTMTVDGEPQELIATYPDLYPYFRPEVRAPKLHLPHHQHPFAKTLCLIGRATENWNIGATLADHLAAQLPRTLDAATSADAGHAATLEEHQGEPFSTYFPYRPAMCLVDSAWVIPDEHHYGALLLGIIEVTRPASELPPMLSAAVLEVRDAKGHVLAQADPAIRQAYGGATFLGRWNRLPDPEAGATADEAAHALALWRIGQDLDPLHAAHRPFKWNERVEFAVRGHLIREEVQYQTEGDGWVFVIRVRPVPPKPQPGKKATPTAPAEHYFARAGRAGREDLWARATELAPLGTKHVAMVGLGCLGATSAWEFGRAGLKRVRVLEDDVVEPGTAMRWPFGLAVAGMWKVFALAALLRRNYPFTEFEGRVRRLGAVRLHEGESDEGILDWLLEGADIVYDASAEVGVQHALADYAVSRRLPYIRVAASPGAWGGYVLRIRPGETAGCPWCFDAHREDGFANPPEDPHGHLQPVGCDNPTYVGPGYELAQVALQGVRLAVATLCAGDDGFPAAPWDVAVIRLRDAGGGVLAPEIQTYPLERHPHCLACGTPRP